MIVEVVFSDSAFGLTSDGSLCHKKKKRIARYAFGILGLFFSILHSRPGFNAGLLNADVVELGRHARLKIVRQSPCGFNSHHRYTVKTFIPNRDTLPTPEAFTHELSRSPQASFGETVCVPQHGKNLSRIWRHEVRSDLQSIHSRD